MRERRRVFIWATVGAAVGFLLSCTDGPSGPARPVPARFAIAPRFASPIAGIVDIDRIRFLVVRERDGSTAKDTTIELGLDADSVDLSVSVLLLHPDERFMLSLALVTPAGDTAFRAGPLTVQPSAGTGPIPVAAAEFVYTGIGAHAASVAIVEVPIVPLLAGATAPLTAVAFDDVGEPIPGTPIGWRSLDETVVEVPDPGVGMVLAGSQRGSARIVAELLTGPADTATVGVTLPPVAILAESGSGQSGLVTSLLPNPLVARVTASDGVGVPDLPVTFTVTAGGGTLSLATATTDADGRAAVQWTLGPNVGPQTVTARTDALPGMSATFTATGLTTGPGSVAVFAGDGQGAVVGTAVPIAPAVIVRDAQSTPVEGAPVTFAVTQGGGAITGGTATTNSQGIAAVGNWTMGSDVGTNMLTASVAGLSPVVFTAVATGLNGAFTMVASAGDGQRAAVGTALEIVPEVTVLDTVGKPAAGVPVTFSVTAGGGVITGATPVTATDGTARVGGWTLGILPGTNTLTASVTGLTPIVFAATGLVGAPAAVGVVSGDAQTAEAGAQLSQPLVLEVRDDHGNPVPNVTVTFTTLQGTLNPPSAITDATGQAQTTWTLGTNAVPQTATATVDGLSPLVFSATATFPNPTILLALTSGSNRIVSGGTATLQVTLTAPAPQGGVRIGLSSDNAGIIAVQSPSTVDIPQDGTTGQIGLDAAGGGTTTIRATGAGYADGAVGLIASVQVLSMPATLNVAFGAAASLPLQISTPAPAGGVEVTLVSDDPGAVALLAPIVTIPAGAQTASATVSGIFPGLATITGTTADFGSATSRVSTTANLNIVQTSATINASFGTTLTVRLESAGAPVAAPSPGIQVSMVPRDPTCVAATSPIAIPTGLVDVTTAVTYGGSATLSCSTFLVATAPDIAPDSLNVGVNPQPFVSLGATTSTGSGLQRIQFGGLGASNHGGATVRVTSADPAIALVSPDATTPGTAFVDIPIPVNGTSFSYYVQGVEGQTGTVTITATEPRFTTANTGATIVPPALDVIGVTTTTTTLSPTDPFQVRIGVPNATNTGMAVEEELRAGGSAVTATLTNSDAAVAQLFTLAGGVTQAATVTIPVGQARSPFQVVDGAVELQPLGGGTTTVSGTIPGFIALPTAAVGVTISTPGLSLSATTSTGSGLQRIQFGGLGASNHGGTTVRITSSNPTVALVSPDAATPGMAFIDIPIGVGGTSFSYYVQGVEAQTGTVTLTATAPGFTDGVQSATIVQPALDIIGLVFTTTAGAANDDFNVRIGIPNATNTGMAVEEELRAGGVPITVTVTNSAAAVAQLVAGTTGQSVLVGIPIGLARSANLEFDPIAAGSTTVAAAIPGFVTLPTASQAVMVNP